MTIYTFGYTMKTDGSALGYLMKSNYDALDYYTEEHSIDILLDIRWKPKFPVGIWASENLEKYCFAKGIIYFSCPVLGNVSSEKNWLPLDKPLPALILDTFAMKIKTTGISILVFSEQDYFERSYTTDVANQLAELSGDTVIHLR